MELKHIVLYAHGSSDPLWQAAVEVLKKEMCTRIKANVTIAYMERCKPSLEEVVEDVYAHGVRELSVIPLFLAPGGHMANDVIPCINNLRKKFPQISIDLGCALLDSQHIRNAIIEDLLIRLGR